MLLVVEVFNTFYSYKVLNTYLKPVKHNFEFCRNKYTVDKSKTAPQSGILILVFIQNETIIFFALLILLAICIVYNQPIPV